MNENMRSLIAKAHDEGYAGVRLEVQYPAGIKVDCNYGRTKAENMERAYRGLVAALGFEPTFQDIIVTTFTTDDSLPSETPITEEPPPYTETRHAPAKKQGKKRT
jgi:hypothetical protein